jgi:hypothetical protein
VLILLGAIGQSRNPAAASASLAPTQPRGTLAAVATPQPTQAATPTTAVIPSPIPTPTPTPKPTAKPTPTPAPTAAPTSAPQLSREQENAIGLAEDYLEYTAFSRSGLIDQLEFEGFGTKVATFAVDYLKVNWKEQAWLMAEAYLDYSHFSRSGLIGQLEFEGFTHAQAVYGVDKAGL